MKRYRLPLSPVFPATHPRKGQPTNFHEKIQFSRQAVGKLPPTTGEYQIKLHTIRENVKYWSKRIDNILAGKAVLEVYEWIGKPYGKGSTTKTLFTLDKDSGIGYQKLVFGKNSMDFPRAIRDTESRIALIPSNLANNDGLTLVDFKDWFRKSDLSKEKIIIHFTDFRY